MKTAIKLLSLSFVFLTACTEDEQITAISEAQKIVMSVEDFKFDNQTRTSLTPTDDGAVFKWSANDTVGIFPETGSQIAFPMTSGAGTNTATFTGGGWALKTSTPYMAYYPMKGKFYLDKENIPVSYSGQSQTENASTAHLGKFDYMVASATTPANNSSAVNFQFKHLGALVRLKVTMKEHTTIKRITLQTDNKDFIQKGYIDLTSTTPTIDSKYDYNKSNTFDIYLNDITVEKDNDLIVYFLMPPVDLRNKPLNAVILKDNGYYQEIPLTGKNFEAGKPYELTVTMASEEESPTTINVETAGTFETIMYEEYGSNCLELTSLKITGNLNGTDIRFIRKMAGRKEDGAAYPGNLTYLDLTDANIVAGGDYYYKPKSGTEYKTENNVASNYMFYFCNLKTLKFPSTITKIGENVCSHLPQPDGNENVEDNHIGTFTSITIPSGVTYIGNYAFAWNQNLASIELPNTLKEMGYLLFYRCDALTTLNIPNSVEKDGGYTFMWCSNLQFVHISENPKYTTINGSSFLGCKSLTTLTIPANITTIVRGAFADMDSSENPPSALKEIHFKSTTPPSMYYDNQDLSDSGLPSNCKIYVPMGCYSTYKASKTFKNYTIIEE
ncbi:MAG: leucine-rich repeat protein [Bacteroides sp.]|nr:leucine-rich repeat protein [Bacteroides sp.]